MQNSLKPEELKGVSYLQYPTTAFFLNRRAKQLKERVGEPQDSDVSEKFLIENIEAMVKLSVLQDIFTAALFLPWIVATIKYDFFDGPGNGFELAAWYALLIANRHLIAPAIFLLADEFGRDVADAVKTKLESITGSMRRILAPPDSYSQVSYGSDLYEMNPSAFSSTVDSSSK